MDAVAGGGVGDLYQVALKIAAAQNAECARTIELSFQSPSPDAETGTGNLHKSASWNVPGAEQNGQANQPFTPHNAYFNGNAVAHGYDDRRHPLFKKVSVAVLLAGQAEVSILWQAQRFQIGLKAGDFTAGKARQYQIFIFRSHGCSSARQECLHLDAQRVATKEGLIEQ